ncbi:glycosyl hydrolase 115 family protein [Crossiella sp. SN42]|uniref:glycosyl hydrolase 115 family protein n=1 Tax=Crossiella sp. SN42 TaxID=2944808 RepID=UPI00207CF6E9|nr:glycosyl hydrolase 115 family protein [Crossiella sp. SN42]MCO1576950.1 glycosyl hydrolase 115 family protein [Crossiella sp. SN42]
MRYRPRSSRVLRARPALWLAAAVLVLPLAQPVPGAQAQEPGDGYLSHTPVRDGFTLAAAGRAAPLVVSAADHPGVVRVVGDLREDVGRVTGVKPAVSVDQVPRQSQVVLIGTIGKSPLIDGLVAAGKLDVSGIAGKWETSLQQVVANPLPTVDRALVIAGSDQRGTIYGVYDVSKRIGVSPWHWWNDVPARQHSALYVRPGRHSQGTPAVRYRGFFVNDEDPQTGTWAPGQFGPGKAPGHPNGLNSRYYEKVFEVMLRLKANYLWPAVWGRAFAEDDPANHATATRYGVVMGSSHEAPMMRGIEEWNRNPRAHGGTGEWSFVRNPEAVKAYWREGIRRMRAQDFEGVVTLGMRGNGDTKLPDGDAIELMEKIIATQRQILTEEAGRPVTEVPQVWTLYKEVQRYWDKGLRAPEDVTVVFADDNWGNMRKLPQQNLPPHAGGYGLYYHFDYVGGSRNYKWADTVNLASTWEQLRTSHTYGVDRLWVANVGDLKNMERPTQFFLDYAWNPAALTADRIDDWEREFAAQNFGAAAAPAVAGLLHTYGQLQARRKPESTNRKMTRTATGAVSTDDTTTPFSIENYAELERVTAEWQSLAARAESVRATLPRADQDAYYQLVFYPIKATANLYALRQAQFLNRRYWTQGRAAANDLADLAAARLAEDKAMSEYYNTTLAGGKWRGWQTETKFGYGDKERYGKDASWQSPPAPDEIYPKPQRVSVPAAAELGVAIAGSRDWWPNSAATPVLPAFSPHQTQPEQHIELFNRGATAFDYRISTSVPWLTATPAEGTVGKQVRATIRVDWSKAPWGTFRVPITVTGAGRTVTVEAVLDNPAGPAPAPGFVEANGYVSMEAEHHSAAVGGNGVSWLRVPDLGRTGSGMTPDPPTAATQTPGAGPRLEYRINLRAAGPVTVWSYLSPRNNVLYGNGIRYAVSIDDQPAKIVNTTAGVDDTTMNALWGLHTADGVNRSATTFTVDKPGAHTVKFWMVDPTVVVQKLVVDTGGLAESYLGPPESHRVRSSGSPR